MLGLTGAISIQVDIWDAHSAFRRETCVTWILCNYMSFLATTPSGLQCVRLTMFPWIDKAPLPDMRSTTTTVTLSRLPRSTAALVSTVAAMRAADWRVAPLWRARRRQRFARLQASWLVSTSQRPSLASSSSSSSGLRASMVICGQ